MTIPVVDVQGLYHTYMAGTPLAQEALRGIDMRVERGQAAALIGVTGSGKSTLLQHLNGLLRPQKGHVWVNGQELGDPAVDLRHVRRTVGLVFQRPEQQLFEEFVGDDVAYGPRLAGLRGPALRERVRWAMELAGLDFERHKDRRISTLSGGERRKAGLAGALAQRPETLLLDEPTAGLDPASHAELLEQVQRWRREGMTLVLATHNMDDVAAIADVVYVLQEGRIALQGTPRQVFAQAQYLESLGLAVPSAVSIAAALRARGLPIPNDLLTLPEVECAVLALLDGSHHARASGENDVE